MAASTPLRVDNSPGRAFRVGGLVGLVVMLGIAAKFAAYARNLMAVTEANPSGGSAGGSIILGIGWIAVIAGVCAALWCLIGRDVTVVSPGDKSVKRGVGIGLPVLWRGCGFGEVSSVALSAYRISMDKSTYTISVRYGPQGKRGVTVADNQANRGAALDLARKVSALVGRPVQDRSQAG